MCGDECTELFTTLPRFPNHHDSFATTARVGSLSASTTGRLVNDMLGNVFEWVADGYAPYSANPASNPIGDPASPKRSARGGGWRDDDPARVTLTDREGIVPDTSAPTSDFAASIAAEITVRVSDPSDRSSLARDEHPQRSPTTRPVSAEPLV